MDTSYNIIMDSLLCPLEKESPYIFCKFNPLNTDTSLIRTLSMAPSVSILNMWRLTVFIYNNNVPSYFVVFTVSIETVKHYAVMLRL